MTLLVTTTVACDGDGCLARMPPYVSARAHSEGPMARREAADLGWLFLRSRGDFCPPCARKLKAERIISMARGRKEEEA